MKHVQVDHLEWNQIRFRLGEFDYPYSMFVNCFTYTSRGHVSGFYGKAILFDSKARKQAHSELCNCFRNAVIGQKSALENRKCGRAKYILIALQNSIFILPHPAQ
jgi:hypothetical protein